VTHERLRELLSTFASRRVAVFGDYFLDRYLDFDPDLSEVSLETNKTAHQVVRVRHSPGAAGNVVRNLQSLGCGSITALGFCGDDGEGYELRQDLTSLGCGIERLFVVPERMTPVYLKPQNIRVPGLEGESERFDTQNRQALPEWVEESLTRSLHAQSVDAIIVVDQVEMRNCGAVTDRIGSRLAELAVNHPNIIFWADSRWRISEYPGFVIKPNQHEAVAAASAGVLEPTDESVLDAGRTLSGRSGKPVFLTRAEQGILVFDGVDCEVVRGVRLEGPVDPTGAGDSVTAAAVLALAGGATPVEAALVANLAASITVQQIGTTGTAAPDQVLDRLSLWLNQAG